MTPGDIPHDEIRERRDRSWTLRLLDLARDERVPAEERDEAFGTIWELNDPRATRPCGRCSRTPASPWQRTRAAGALWYWDMVAHGPASPPHVRPLPGGPERRDILEAFRRLGVTPPDLGHFRDADHLDLVEAVFAHDPDAPPPRWLAAATEA